MIGDREADRSDDLGAIWGGRDALGLVRRMDALAGQYADAGQHDVAVLIREVLHCDYNPLVDPVPL